MNFSHARSLSFGFTLIELLITIAIIGIVMGIGTASYRDYQKRTNDEYGKQKILEVMAQEKINYLQQRRFTTSFQQLGYPSEMVTSENDYFKLSLSSCGAQKLTQCVQATATPTGDQTTGTIFTLTSGGERSPVDAW